jgi:hypothetical protein
MKEPLVDASGSFCDINHNQNIHPSWGWLSLRPQAATVVK